MILLLYILFLLGESASSDGLARPLHHWSHHGLAISGLVVGLGGIRSRVFTVSKDQVLFNLFPHWIHFAFRSLCLSFCSTLLQSKYLINSRLARSTASRRVTLFKTSRSTSRCQRSPLTPQRRPCSAARLPARSTCLWLRILRETWRWA